MSTMHARAMGMRKSIEMYWDWTDGAKEMVRKKELRFEWRGGRLTAIRRHRPRSREELLKSIREQIK